jgi:hypothetical protein
VYHPVLDHAVQRTGALGMTQQQAYVAVNRSISKQAAQLRVNDISYASALIWIASPERVNSGAPDAAAAAH